MPNLSLHLTVHSRESVIFDGKIVSLTSYNDKGKFDITLNHANFISLVQKSLIIELDGGGKREIRIDNGILRVVDNKINVYLGIRQPTPLVS